MSGGERESLWGAQRKRASVPAEQRQADDGASPKAQQALDLQRRAGNAAVTGAVQRSMWGDMEDFFGGGGSDAALKGGGGESPGMLKGVGGDAGALKGFGGGGPGLLKGVGGGGTKGSFPEPVVAEKGDAFDQPMGGTGTDAEKGYADREEKGGYDGWDQGPAAAPSADEQAAKGEDVWLN